MSRKGIVRSEADILALVSAPASIQMDSSVGNKGIDNYRIDVELSAAFVFNGKEVVESLAKQVVAGSKIVKSDILDDLRRNYSDLLRATLHRVKTDLSAPVINILQFAVIKFVLQETRTQIDHMSEQMEETLSQQKFAGSRSLLATQERFTRFRQNRDSFTYKINRAIFKQLQREETSELRQLRELYLGNDIPELLNIMYNPMLSASNPLEDSLLHENYALWNRSEFPVGIEKLEAHLGELFPAIPLLPLKSKIDLGSAQSEIYDELGGLFSAQNLLGPSEDQKVLVSESFCWLDQPGNVRFVFDSTIHHRSLAVLKNQDGMKAQWAFKADVKKLVRAALDARKMFADDTQFKEMIAGYALREKWSLADGQFLDIRQASAYAAGNDTKKILAKIDLSKDGATAFIKKLDDLSRQVNQKFKEEAEEYFLKILTDISRFRLHIKYYRFAHRIFNRMNIIQDPEKLQLAKSGGNLYQLVTVEEAKLAQSDESEIIHHTIIKADVRGSTTVTQELINQGLNPASYFSLRFFDPINQLLAKYGAAKVFIEGDAVILGIYEHNDALDQWYSVSRACGVAKEILDIVNSKNSHSKLTGLPSLEIGIGICYSGERPLFLFDDKRAIMISPAIGIADRMSSCSWHLRDYFNDSTFNVEVLSVDGSSEDVGSDDDGQEENGALPAGEKGQKHVNYNVNGVLLDVPAFRKLMSEISLKKIRVKVAEKSEVMFVGKFPDTLGKERELVIREGRVNKWNRDRIAETDTAEDEALEFFYEVLPNSKLASKVIEVARLQAQAKSAHLI
ncbi:MAG: hypothetical protein ACJAVI_002350 [Candidatus Azotimanducaceae bacterium]|jgi:hypothetical protein